MKKMYLHMKSGETYQLKGEMQSPYGRVYDKPIDTWLRDPERVVVLKNEPNCVVWTRLSSIESIEEKFSD